MEKQLKRLLKLSICIIISSFAFLTKTHAQPTAIFKVENFTSMMFFRKEQPKNMQWNCQSFVQFKNGFYYFSNEWTEIGSYSTGKMFGWEEIDDESAFNFDEEVDYTQAHSFKWKYENSYDRDHGIAKVVFIEFGEDCERFFQCAVTIESENLELKYEGYRQL